jgi:glycosyltransferase
VRISVVTVVRNAASAMPQAVESVAAQCWDDVEHIVVDGGSTDGTAEYLLSRRERFAHLVIEPDSGPTEALNKAMPLATGEFTCFLLAGDWLEPGAFALVRAAADCGDLLCGDMLNWRGGEPLYVSRATPARLRREMSVNFPATFFRTSVLRQAGPFDEAVDIATDYDMILRCLVRGAKVARVEAVLANMSLDGRSSRHWVKGYWHCALSRMRHLGSPARCVAAFGMQVARTATRKLLERMGLGALVSLYRERAAPCRKSRAGNGRKPLP